MIGTTGATGVTFATGLTCATSLTGAAGVTCALVTKAFIDGKEGTGVDMSAAAAKTPLAYKTS